MFKQLNIKSHREAEQRLDRLSRGSIVSLLSYLTFWNRTAWVFNVAKWKRPLVKQYLTGHRLRFLALKNSVYAKHTAISLSPRPVFVVWGMIEPDDLQEYATEYGIPIIRMEDGFFRSIGLGSNHNLPFSLCIDSKGMYFDSSTASDLEEILSKYEFSNDSRLMDTANLCLSEIRAHGLSKYNEIISNKAPLLYGPKVRPRILVLGQVEDDQSLLYGCQKIMTNVELIKLAAAENPSAQIIYKTHPDILSGRRNEISDVTEVNNIAEIIPLPISLQDALYEVDRVYTLTSLAGFEALIRGVPVTTVGAPFYSGWGVTDDRQKVERRNRSLSVEEIFAASYLLYPKYINPETKKKTSLTEVIEIFKERLSYLRFLSQDEILRRIKPFNFATRNKVSSRFLYNSTIENIAIVTDSEHSLRVAQGLAAKGKKVTILTTRDTLANDEALLLSFEEGEHITVSSIHKKYSVPLSPLEQNAVNLSRNFSSDLFQVLSKVAGSNLNAQVLGAMAAGVEEYVYFESLRFLAAEQCLDQFDAVLLLLDDAPANLDMSLSLLYHARKKHQLGKVYLECINVDGRSFIDELFEKTVPQLKSAPELEAIKSKFTSFWWSLQDSKFDDYSEMGQFVAVCGNIGNNNYAYEPASLKLISVVGDNTSLPVLYYSSGLLGPDGQNSTKTVTLNENLSRFCTVYNGCIPQFQKKYPSDIIDQKDFFSEALYDSLLHFVRMRSPNEFVHIFSPRLKKYVDSLFAYFIFASESSRVLEKCKLFGTSMDRSIVSKILSALALEKKVTSVGIQPQILSTSPRYSAPTVDIMGVIDSSQVDVYSQLGSGDTRLVPVGSVNLFARLIQIQESEAVCTTDRSSRPVVLFAMQHSSARAMISSALALRDIALKHNITVLVKPHPHQELPILNEVKRIFGGSSNVEILSKNADTYQAVAQSDVIVGLFSSVLFESAIARKAVLITAFDPLHDSIDFSQRGLALKVTLPEQLESTLMELLARGDLYESLMRTQAEYLELNPHFLPPYSTSHLDGLILSAIGS